MSSNPIRDLNQIYLNEVSADTALAASKAADKKRGQLASAGDKEGAAAKAQQASRLYKASAEKRKSEPAKQPDRSYPKGKGASYQEDKDWGYDKDGNSLNPVDIEKRKKKDDDLAGSPNYETKKKAEVLSAMKKQGRKLSDKEKSKIADKVVKDKGDTSKSDDRYAYEELTHIRSLVEKVSTVNEGIGRAIKKGVKIAKRVVKDAGPYDPGGYTSIGSLGNPHLGNEKKRAKERAAKRGVSEAKVDDVKYSKDEERKNYETDVHTLSSNKGVRTDRNKRHSATDVAFKGHAATHRDRMQKHYKSRGVKTKGMKEDKAFNYVLGKLKDKYGSAVMTKGDKMPEPSAAQKKKNDAIRAKRAKEDHSDPTEKASDGRYSDRYSNRGSD